MKIPLKKIKKGDFVHCTGDSGFCHSSIEEVIKITTQYTQDTGKQFKVIWLAGERKFDTRDGCAMNPPLAYYIEPTDQKVAELLIGESNTVIEKRKKEEMEYEKKKKKILSKLTPKEREILGF